MANYTRHHEYVGRAEAYIERHSEGHLTEKEIACELGIDPSYFVQIFRREKGLTPKKYLDQQMTNRVLQFLASERMFGYKISYELGFSSEQAFYRWVRRVFGVSFKQLSKAAHQNTVRDSIVSGGFSRLRRTTHRQCAHN